MEDLECIKFGGEEPRKARALELAKKLYTTAGWTIK